MKSQPSLKSQDIVVALKAALSLGEQFTYAEAAAELGLSPSRIHSSVQMLVLARLAKGGTREGLVVNRPRVTELLIHGVPYFFPPVIGGITRGVASAYGERAQSELVDQSEIYVWPFSEGEDRGIALAPLHQCVLFATRKDRALYKVLAAVDALRVGAARERAIAIKEIRGLME